MSIIRDINLAPSGENKIEWVRRNCPLLRSLEADFSKSKPFAGKRIALSIHLEAKTAYLCRVLALGHKLLIDQDIAKSLNRTIIHGH